MAPNIGELANKYVSMAEDIARETTDSLVAPKRQSKWQTLIAAASAGLMVDTVLFPVDTVKSRLQSAPGFIKSGGFSNVYRGLTPVVVGSVPNAALFFITYESVKDKLHQYKPLSPKGHAHILSHMIAAALGEAVSTSVRVPYEVVKMRSQTSVGKHIGNMAIVKEIMIKEGLTGLYRGLSSTVIRDLPFSAIQYSLWERFKIDHLKRHKKPVSASKSAWYGSIAGAIAAFVTTPLDVAKTRIMLAERSESLASGKVKAALKAIHAEKGIRGLFAGAIPRVVWISVGAAIFLGSYEKAIKILS